MVGGAIINIIQSGQALLFLFESHLFDLGLCLENDNFCGCFRV